MNNTLQMNYLYERIQELECEVNIKKPIRSPNHTERIIKELKHRLEENINYTIRQKKYIESYRKKTGEELKRLKLDNKQLLNKLMKVDKPQHFTIKRPVPKKYIRRCNSDTTDLKSRKNLLDELNDTPNKLRDIMARNYLCNEYITG
tara:strand:+ start:162 stop:602 length:441 start_codon:yes stop_codon:yes gene_type:complete